MNTSGSHQFLFLTCQRGAENPLKAEMARQWPELRFAFSRPGFLTFKGPEGQELPDDVELGCVFGRAFGISIGGVQGDSTTELVHGVWQNVEQALPKRNFDVLHIWQTDRNLPGRRGYVPELGEQVPEVREALLAEAGERIQAPLRTYTEPGELVLDVILIDKQHWWVGYHRVCRGHLPWPGGLSEQELPQHAISRAYQKIEQALEWSQLPLEPGQVVCELGSSPGGTAQALLERGLHVIGIDPAEMDPAVLEHPNFTHIRRRTPAVPRKVYQSVDWITSDMGVYPNYTLDAVEEIVLRPGTHIRGLLLTLKLFRWELAEEIPALLERVRSWGFAEVHARQLQYHKQDFALAAWQPQGKSRQGKRAGRLAQPPRVS